jgi:hypothetical protein
MAVVFMIDGSIEQLWHRLKLIVAETLGASDFDAIETPRREELRTARAALPPSNTLAATLPPASATLLRFSLISQQALQSASNKGPCSANLPTRRPPAGAWAAKHVLRTEMPMREFANSVAPEDMVSAATCKRQAERVRRPQRRSADGAHNSYFGAGDLDAVEQ